MRSLFTLYLFITCCSVSAQNAIGGYVTDSKNGEALIGVSVFTANRISGTTTNAYGFFSLSVPSNDSVYFQYLGYEPQSIKLSTAKTLTIKLKEATGELKEALVVGERNEPQHGSTHINMKLLNSLPAMGGERDLVKALQLMPGIKKGADGTAGMLVRGGAHDQNLILLDDAPVYNPSHLLGFFSLFNTDAINDATIQTGGFTANYGGRLSSVLDIHTLNGNMEKTVYSGSVGLLASRATVQVPVFKGKGSVMVAGRVSYINKLYELTGKKLPFYFYDFNAKINYRLTANDRVFLSVYDGDDILDESESPGAGTIRIKSKMGNQISSLRWNHAFSNKKQFSNLTLFSSRYRYQVDADLNESNLKISSNITDVGIRYGIQHQVNNRLSLRYGAEMINHTFNPNSTKMKGSFNENIKDRPAQVRMMKEAALYLSSQYNLSTGLLLSTGLRYSAAQSGKAVYSNPEPRVQLDYRLKPGQTVSVAYSEMVQYMFLLSGSSAVLPTDLWYGISERIKPQHAQIISLGYQYTQKMITVKAEAYYKPMQKLVEYKEGTIDLVNGDIDDKIIQGKGKAYGFELSTKISNGKFNAIIGYTLSWSNRTFSGLNNDRTFLARYDRRHDISLIANYELSKRTALSAVWCYATGSRFTAITGQFMMPDGNYTDIDLLPLYSGRNAIQLSASHRLDMNLIIKNNPGKKYRAEWHIGAYNVYNQTQPYRIKMQKNDDGSYAYKQVGLFGFVPSIAYQFTF
ncbi:MAG: TonB-dependent receptor [Bacteroidota bacterium]